MRIGLDGIPLANLKTGIGHYTFELARSLALIAPQDDFELISPFPFLTELSQQTLPENLRLERARASLLGKRWWAVGLPLHVKRAAYALFHGTNYDIPLWNRCPAVVTIHDLSVLIHPHMHERRIVRRARRRLPIMARAATMIITATEHGKREVCEHLGVEPDRVAVTPYAPRRNFRPVPPAQAAEVRKRLKVEDEFLLFVGTIEPRKNLLTLVRAYEEILRASPFRPQLVIAGREGWLMDDLFAYIKGAGLQDRLRFTGYISDEDLSALYSSCRAFIYPSLYEGFGLPPLEAMACGAPVITSRIHSISEVVGRAAHLVEPTDARAMAQSIIRLLGDDAEREKLRTAARERAAEFTWEKTAEQTLEIYRQALKKWHSAKAP
ncbi:MAG TPA: glycosyltransferase family 1 protein [Pyrinomonadaceae bacterium]|jgi:glycosyltransferase involved in cell wall biosynthesis